MQFCFLKWYKLGVPPTQDASHHQDYEPIFRIGNPNKQNLHLPRLHASWVGSDPRYKLLSCHQILPVVCWLCSRTSCCMGISLLKGQCCWTHQRGPAPWLVLLEGWSPVPKPPLFDRGFRYPMTDPWMYAWHILGDRLIPEQLLWVDRGILHITYITH